MPLPEMPSPALAENHPTRIAPMRLADRPPQTVFAFREHDQVNVVRHQAIGHTFRRAPPTTDPAVRDTRYSRPC